MSRTAMLFLMIFIVILMSEPSLASTITLNGTNGGNLADSFVAQNGATSNYGTSNVDYTNDPSTTYGRGIFIIWNTSVIPAGATITNANFSMYLVIQDNTNKAVFAVWNTSLNQSNSSTTPWTEYNLAWNDMPNANILQDTVVKASTVIGTWYYWNVTNATITAYNSANKNMSLKINNLTLSGSGINQKGFASKENVTAATRPQLVITYTVASGTTYNASGSFSLSMATTNARTYKGVKSISLSLTESLLNSRIASLNRASLMSLSLSTSNIKTYLVNRLLTFTLTDSFLNSRTLNAVRTSSLSLSESIAFVKRTIFGRLNSFSLSMSQSNSRTYQGVRQPSFSLSETLANIKSTTFNRANSFSLSLTESSSRTLNAVRLETLSLILNTTGIGKLPYAVYSYLLSMSLNLIENANTYIARWESVNPYRVCSILQQIGTSKAYLCVYDDGTWKVLIKGS